MEKKNTKLKADYKQLFSQLSKVFKDSLETQNESYHIGRKEAFEEILHWFLTSHNMDLKYVSATSFLNMIQEKLTKEKLIVKSEVAEDRNEELNLNEIKISDSRKRSYKPVSSVYEEYNEFLMMDSGINSTNYNNNSLTGCDNPIILNRNYTSVDNSSTTSGIFNNNLCNNNNNNIMNTGNLNNANIPGFSQLNNSNFSGFVTNTNFQQLNTNPFNLTKKKKFK